MIVNPLGPQCRHSDWGHSDCGCSDRRCSDAATRIVATQIVATRITPIILRYFHCDMVSHRTYVRKLRLEGHTDAILCMAISTEGNLLASGGMFLAVAPATTLQLQRCRPCHRFRGGKTMELRDWSTT